MADDCNPRIEQISTIGGVLSAVIDRQTTVILFAQVMVPPLPAYSLQPASPELVGQLTKELSVTPQQATGGAGALFSLTKTKLSPLISAKSQRWYRAWIVF